MTRHNLVRRLEALEAIQPDPALVVRHVLVDVVSAGVRLPAEERERRIAEAQKQAGLHGLVIVVDCPSCGEVQHEL